MINVTKTCLPDKEKYREYVDANLCEWLGYKSSWLYPMIVQALGIMRRACDFLKWRERSIEINSRFESPGKRIIYAITPTPALSNLGDQAQVVAIYKWLERSYPEHTIIEVNKDEVINCVNSFKGKVLSGDLIVLHSGGNLGDNNKILSLPQTINFRSTDKGRAELKKSRRIYNNHKNLTIIARDDKSYKLANQYFDQCATKKTPDFVLSYDTSHLGLGKVKSNGKALFCLREDDESAVSAKQRALLVGNCALDYDVYDTTIPENIENSQRLEKLDEVLRMFAKYEYVVTDRFHGLIFSILCKKPTVVLKTVDHKLTSAFDWFDDVKFVRFAGSIDTVSESIDRVIKETDFRVPDWNERYFDPLKKYL